MFDDTGGDYKDSNRPRSSSPQVITWKWPVISPKWMVQYRSIMFGSILHSNKITQPKNTKRIYDIFTEILSPGWFSSRTRWSPPAAARASPCGAWRQSAIGCNGRRVLLETWRRWWWWLDDILIYNNFKTEEVLKCWVQLPTCILLAMLLLVILFDADVYHFFHLTHWSMKPTS